MVFLRPPPPPPPLLRPICLAAAAWRRGGNQLAATPSLPTLCKEGPPARYKDGEKRRGGEALQGRTARRETSPGKV